MGQLLVALDPGAGIAPGALAEAWNADGEASAAGTARVVEAASRRDFFPGLVELHTDLGREQFDLLVTSGDSHARALGQAATRAEYANFTAALAYALQTGQPISGLILPLDEYLGQAQQQTARRQLLDDAIADYPQPADDAQSDELARLHNLAGIAATDQHRLDDAKAHHETELQLHKAAGRRKPQAVTYHNLGAVAQEQRRFDEAEAAYRQALDIKLEFGDRQSAAKTYHQLGVVALEQWRFAEAEATLRQALDIYLEFGDRYSTASTYSQLGQLAAEQRRFAEAEAAFRQALEIYLEFGDRYSTASIYQNLGAVAYQQERFDEAEAAYRQALDIFRESDARNASIVATSLGQMLSSIDRHFDATTILLDGALLWHQLTGNWDPAGLRYLKRERQLIGEADFKQIITAKVPHDLQEALTTAVTKADDP
jgi:tetratricopeptide (TPR) repeat protein